MKKILPLIALIWLAAGCRNEPETKVKHGDQLIFTTENTLLSNGDVLGVNMDSPLGYRNVKMTLSGGSLTPVNPLYWPVDMPDSAVTFYAYYPYSSSYDAGGNVTFAAAPDQREDAAFRSSNLMLCSTKASVTDPSVVFNLEPKMSKIVLYIRNDTGSAIKSVSMTAYPSVQFQLGKTNVRLNGSKVEMTAHLSATSADGVEAYELVIAPQNTQVTFAIKTDAAQYQAVLGSDGKFESGMQYSNARLLVLEAGMTKPVSFSFNAGEWAAAPDFVYREPISGGAEFSELTEPGVYGISGASASPLRVYSAGSDQTARSVAGDSRKWRLMNPAEGVLLSIVLTGSSLSEGTSYPIKVVSFGIEGVESDFSSSATVVKVSDGFVWLMDDVKEYGYIITAI